MVRFSPPAAVLILWLWLSIGRCNAASVRQPRLGRSVERAKLNVQGVKSTTGTGTPIIHRRPRSLQDKVVDTPSPPKATPAPIDVDPSKSLEPSVPPLPSPSLPPDPFLPIPAPQTRAPSLLPPVSRKVNLTLTFDLQSPPQLDVPNVTSEVQSGVLAALELFFCADSRVSWDRGATTMQPPCSSNRSEPLQIPSESPPWTVWEPLPRLPFSSRWVVSFPTEVSDSGGLNSEWSNATTTVVNSLLLEVQESLNTAIRQKTFDQLLESAGLELWTASVVGDSNTTAPSDAETTSPYSDSSEPSYRRGVDELRLVGVFMLVLTLDSYVVLLWLAYRRRKLKRREAAARDDPAASAPLVTKNSGDAGPDGENESAETRAMRAASDEVDTPTLALTSSTFSEIKTKGFLTPADQTKPSRRDDPVSCTSLPPLPSMTISGIQHGQSPPSPLSPSSSEGGAVLPIGTPEPDQVPTREWRPILRFT